MVNPQRCRGGERKGSAREGWNCRGLFRLQRFDGTKSSSGTGPRGINCRIGADAAESQRSAPFPPFFCPLLLPPTVSTDLSGGNRTRTRQRAVSRCFSMDPPRPDPDAQTFEQLCELAFAFDEPLTDLDEMEAPPEPRKERKKSKLGKRCEAHLSVPLASIDLIVSSNRSPTLQKHIIRGLRRLDSKSVQRATEARG